MLESLPNLTLCLVGGFTSWTATELARRAEPQARMSALLELSHTWVVPEAVKLWWESRGAYVKATEEKESEDAQLDLLNFLSEKRERAGLFKLRARPKCLVEAGKPWRSS